MEITIGDYIEYSKLSEGTSEDKVVSTLLGFDVRSLPIDKAEALLKEVRDWFFLEERPFFQTFTHKGVEYGFIPNLDSEISYGENQDLCKYVSNAEDLHRAMAVAYRPIVSRQGSKYSIEKYEGSSKYANEMLDVDINIALGMRVFFWTLTRELQSYILKYTTIRER